MQNRRREKKADRVDGEDQSRRSVERIGFSKMVQFPLKMVLIPY